MRQVGLRKRVGRVQRSVGELSDGCHLLSIFLIFSYIVKCSTILKYKFYITVALLIATSKEQYLSLSNNIYLDSNLVGRMQLMIIKD